MIQRFTSSDGLSLAYTDEGEGTPLLCLAGLTRNGRDFDHVAPHLHGVRLIRPDYRGRGESDYAEDFHSYSIPVEARDVLELMDHLGIEKAAILGTSRGGLIAMALAATAKDRLLGVCLNDIGPEIAAEGLSDIMGYLGRRPAQRTIEAAAAARAKLMDGFAGVPMERWIAEARNHYRQTETGLELRYDKRLRDAVEAAGAAPMPDLWPLFDALDGLPLALIRGANSNLLSPETAAEMRRRRPDMHFADVPGRGHVPFLDETESLAVISAFLEDLA
ncbi:Haloacetate dehalogenase H-1 [Pseudoruegeria aquimaris]|uniref:Haloacetate dehalogenase H-1 n=1 Tax=Pseudoruegeria aquimaris TaxID=393663 RepID=A0A1Y5T0P8_9RHOB|nr:alpha/beta hydrolase [Pseudoruegeria aquimaris]SLN49405.1 Haloacetate dehalogenase H-1 [Pseudoruegeria aquimaris]